MVDRAIQVHGAAGLKSDLALSRIFAWARREVKFQNRESQNNDLFSLNNNIKELLHMLKTTESFFCKGGT